MTDNPEHGMLPEGWEWRELGEVAEFINGRAFKPDDWGTGGLPIIRIQNLTDCDKPFNYYCGEYQKRHFIQNDDILISWSASLGVFRWNRGDALLNQHIFKVDVDDGIIDKDYFFYVAQTKINEMKHRIHGSTMKHITKSLFESIKIPLPPLPTQHKIVEILEKADSVRKKRRLADEKTSKILQAAFVKMFGDPEINPNDYPFKYFENLIEEFRYGSSNKSLDKGHHILRIPNIISGYINLDDLKHTKLTESEFEKLKLIDGDILFVRTNGNQNYVGRCAVFYDLGEPFVYASYLIRVRLKKDLANPEFVKHFFSTSYCRKELILNSRTSAGQYNINTKGLGSIPIFLPPLELQQKFVTLVENVEAMKERQDKSREHIEETFQTLMQKAFRGELVA